LKDLIDVAAAFYQHEFMPLCNSTLLLILIIKLTSIPDNGLVPNAVYEHIFTYLSGTIKHLHISFNLSTQAGVNLYHSQLENLVHNLEHGNLAKYVSLMPIFCV
jgi:hypothetical protein